MSAKQHLVKLLAAVTAALVSCLFVHGYNWACLLSYGPPNAVLTDSIFRNARYAYVVPILMLFFGIVLLRSPKDRSVGLDCLVSLAWIGALLWVLLAIYAWQLTHIEIWSGAPHS